ncbi:MAG: phosphotransferase [Clostridia bacterium]|nr:phosphotransferase [Clostridia bacterium]
MQKKEISIHIDDFPREIHEFFRGAKVYDSSSSKEMRVLYSDLGYYVKIGGKGLLKKEADMTRLFGQRGMGVEVAAYLSGDQDYLVTRCARGEDALHGLGDPERLCRSLAEAMRHLHASSIEGVPVSPCMELYARMGKANCLKQDTFIHGDFCLPNIMLDDGRLSSFIDVGMAGVGDRHIDIYWALWSLDYNLGTDRYADCFLEYYGKERVDKGILKIVAEVEAMA